METIDFGTWDTPEIGTPFVFNFADGTIIYAKVVSVHGSLVTVERIEETSP